MNEVFDPGTLAVRAVPVIAEQLHHRFGHAHHGLHRHIADRPSQHRERVFVAMRHPHAAAYEHVVAHDGAVLDDGQEAEVLAINVDAIILRQGQARLKLSR